MIRRASRLFAASFVMSVAALAIGGCPLETPPSDAVVIGPEPGTYYVEQREEQLYYYQLAEVRGEKDRWVELTDDGSWFTGPGFYCCSEDYTWSRDENADGLTLDEIIQLHDPAPAPGEAE